MTVCWIDLSFSAFCHVSLGHDNLANLKLTNKYGQHNLYTFHTHLVFLLLKCSLENVHKLQCSVFGDEKYYGFPSMFNHPQLTCTLILCSYKVTGSIKTLHYCLHHACIQPICTALHTAIVTCLTGRITLVSKYIYIFFKCFSN